MNVCCQNLEHFHQELIRARERLRHKREIIGNGMRECGSLEQSSPMRLLGGEEKGPNVLYDATIACIRTK